MIFISLLKNIWHYYDQEKGSIIFANFYQNGYREEA
jgi:hypothetical protein